MATDKATSSKEPTLQDVADNHVWELNNIQALLEGARNLLDQLPDNEIRCKVVRLLRMAHEKVDAGVESFMPHV